MNNHARASGNRPDEMFPRTAWTKILSVREASYASCRDSLNELAALYDRPLSKLFLCKLGKARVHDAEDWKQDFIQSHVLTGKIFQNVQSGRPFRTYLSVGVRNFIASKIERARTAKRAPDHARTFSDISVEDTDYTSRIVASTVDEDVERFLSEERALDCFDRAKTALLQWAQCHSDPRCVEIAHRLVDANSTDGRVNAKQGTIEREVIEQYKRLVRSNVRSEVLAEHGDCADELVGREIGILYDALERRRSKRWSLHG
jgi:DNA-directed RNA polymerase specialized sigma24 family protein